MYPGFLVAHISLTCISCISGLHGDAAVIDAVCCTAVVTVTLIFVGEFLNRTKGDADAPWDSSCLLVIAETLLQALLSAQILYAFLRLREQVDWLYALFVAVDLAWIFAQMLTRQWREGWPLARMDWLPVFVLEVWDVINSLAVTVSLAHDDTQWSAGIVDSYVVCTFLTLCLFQVTYPQWKSLQRIAWLSCFSDLVTDGPMLYITITNELWDDNALRSIAAFVNVCLISVGVVIWPLKHYIRGILSIPDGGNGNGDDNDDGGDDNGDNDAVEEGVPDQRRQQLEERLRTRHQTREFFIAEGIPTDGLDVEIAEIKVEIEAVWYAP